MYIKSDKSILMIYDKFDLPNQYTHVSNIILCGPDNSYIYNPLYNATQCGKICYINYFKYKSFDLKTLTNEIIKIKNIIKLDYIYIDDEDIVNDIEKLKVLNDLNVLNEDGQIKEVTHSAYGRILWDVRNQTVRPDYRTVINDIMAK